MRIYEFTNATNMIKICVICIISTLVYSHPFHGNLKGARLRRVESVVAETLDLE